MIELPTHDGGKIYAWIRHVELRELRRDLDGEFEFFNEFAPIVWRDTSLTEWDIIKLSSHVTVARIFETVDDYLNDCSPISYGSSVCSMNDHFSRKHGRMRAIKRALGNIRLLLNHDGVVYPQKNRVEDIQSPHEELVVELV